MTSTVKTACCAPSAYASSRPTIVNAWGVAQFDDVNVNGAPICASPESLENDWITTLPPGCEFSVTVNDSVVPVSDTDTDVFDKVNPGSCATAVPGFTTKAEAASARAAVNLRKKRFCRSGRNA